MQALGRAQRYPLRLYLVGGTVLVDLGLRSATLDIDFVVRAEDTRALDEFERLLPALKERLEINAEPASPADFMPVPSGALAGSRYVRSYGNVHVYYYHLPTLALAKAARGAERDITDIELLLRHGLVTWQAIDTAWQEVRVRETGWLRHTPGEVQRRLDALRERVGPSGQP